MDKLPKRTGHTTLRNKIAYQLCEEFKSLYSTDNHSNHRLKNEQLLFEQYEKVVNNGLKQFVSIVKMIEKHEKNIINYFQTNHTNSKAENMNGKIQRFITNNYGIRDET